VILMRCDQCKHWKETDDSKRYRLPMRQGTCEGISNSEKITFNLQHDLGGGWVENAETDADFFCAEFKVKP
jgi:hypothetical protein